MGDQVRLVAAMEGVREMLPQSRRRSPPEAPWPLTHAYARLIVAVGFARLGDHARARALRDESVAALPYDAGDPVHRVLLDAYALRIEQTCELRCIDLPLSPPLVEQVAALNRVGRYKVDRLRDGSPILSTGRRSIDTIAAYSQHIVTADERLDPDLDALRAIASHDARADAIDQLLTTAPLTEVRQLAAAFTALGELAERDALPILAPAIQRLASGAELSCLLGERAITTAARFGYAELIPDVLARLLAVPSELTPVVPALLHALRRLGAQAEMAALLATVDVPPADPPSAAELVLAGARIAIDDHQAPRARAGHRPGLSTFTVAVRCLSGPMLGQARLDLVRDVARGTTHAPLDFALDQLEQLMPDYKSITDSFGTNSHYCLSVLHFVESLVLAITDLHLATLTPRNPADAAYLAWSYALS